jgi:hypothetical protein
MVMAKGWGSDGVMSLVVVVVVVGGKGSIEVCRVRKDGFRFFGLCSLSLISKGLFVLPRDVLHVLGDFFAIKIIK